LGVVGRDGGRDEGRDEGWSYVLERGNPAPVDCVGTGDATVTPVYSG
jgi:hypothetical protein